MAVCAATSTLQSWQDLPLHVLCLLTAVQSCEPAVPAMAQLLAQLNSGGSFSQFVRCMRREFRAAVGAELGGQLPVAAAAALPVPVS